ETRGISPMRTLTMAPSSSNLGASGFRSTLPVLPPPVTLHCTFNRLPAFLFGQPSVLDLTARVSLAGGICVLVAHRATDALGSAGSVGALCRPPDGDRTPYHTGGSQLRPCERRGGAVLPGRSPPKTGRQPRHAGGASRCTVPAAAHDRPPGGGVLRARLGR